MSYSKEKTYWYLTKTGWVAGDLHYDTGGITKRETPSNYVALYEYVEVYSHAMNKNPIKKATALHISNQDEHDELVKKYGPCPPLN